MATKARQQYFADEQTLQKQLKEFSIADDIQQKIDSVEEGAQVNVIETIRVNGDEVLPDADKAIDLTIPGVVDSLDSTSRTDALSARQGKVLYDYITDVSHIGHFLALWDAGTGLPVTNPDTSPYVYNSGDFYTVSVVAPAGGTNYKPDGTEFVIGQASTTVETDAIEINDFYFYDGTTWRHMKNSGAGAIAIDTSLSTTSTNPVENRVITNAINSKADATDTNTKTFYLSSDSDYTNAQAALDWYLAGKNPVIRYNNITWLVEGTYDTSGVPRTLNFRSNQIPIGRSQYLPATGQSTYILNYQLSIRANTSDAVYNIVFFNGNTIVNFLDTTTNYTYPYIPQYPGSPATKKYVDDHAGKTYTAGANIQISAQDVISATDTKYTAGTGISIDANNVISNTQTSTQWGNIVGNISSQTDLQNALNAKANAADIATVATTGNYNDLTNKPSIPAAQVNSNWNETDATSPAYIMNKPTIPTQTSQLTNNSGFITSSYHDSSKQDVLTLPTNPTAGNVVVWGANNTTLADGGIGTKVFNLPTVNDDITEIVDTISAGWRVVFKEDSGGATLFWNVVGISPISRTIQASALYDGTPPYAYSYEIKYNSSKSCTAVNLSNMANFFAPSNAGSTDQVLTKTSNGYKWAVPTWGVQVDSASPIQITKIRAGTQAQYDALASYDATTVYLTI